MYSVFLIQRRHKQRDSFNRLADSIKLNEKKGSITPDDILPDVSIMSSKDVRKPRWVCQWVCQ